jgi:hypothetical protein
VKAEEPKKSDDEMVRDINTRYRKATIEELVEEHKRTMCFPKKQREALMKFNEEQDTEERKVLRAEAIELYTKRYPMQATERDTADGSNPPAASSSRNKQDIRPPEAKDYTERNWEPRKRGKHPSAEEVHAGEIKARSSGIRFLNVCEQWENGYTCWYGDNCLKANPEPQPLPQPPAPPPPPTSTWGWAEAPQTSTVAEWNAGWHNNPSTRRQIREWQSDHKWSDR